MNKFTKLLSVFIIAGAVGTGIAGVAGCTEKNPNKPSDSGEHTHSYTYVQNADGKTHNGTCANDGCDIPTITNEACVDGSDADGLCDKCGGTIKTEQGGEKEYDLITSSVDFGAAANEIAGEQTTSNQSVGAGGYTYGGKFFFAEGNRFEPGNNCVNTQKKDVTVTLGGETNSIKIVGKGASGTAGDLVLKNSSGTVLGTSTSTGNSAPVSISADDLPAGVYTISSGTSVRITELTITEKLEKSEATGISVTASKVDFLVNEEFTSNGLTVILNYANGRKDTLSASDYEVTHSVDKNTAGKYTVTVKYKENAAFTDTYDVYVYTIDSIEMHTIGFENKKQVTLQQATVTGGALSYDYLTVKGSGTVEGRKYTCNLPAAALNVENVSVATAGEKTVNVSVNTGYTTGGKTLSCSYKVMVKDAVTAANNKVEITVGATGDFKTLTQAVQFLEKCKLDDNVNKVIKLQAGTYTEKVRIELPNVTLAGLGEKADDTKLTYSLVEGDADAINGTLWGLDCATLHVTGANFKAYNLAIRNDFDYIKDAGKYSGTQGPQGLALTLDADGAVIANCHIYGNQDTLFMKSGRSYYYQTQIDGNVDFIFGNETALAYFDECKIVAINRTAVADGEKGGAQNGYVTAAKHVDASKPDYGYIFNNCEFTDDGKVKDGAMSLGRPWGAKATVAYINCSFSAAYSKMPSSDSGKDHRWHDWNSSTTAANADFCEYGSTGAGAITEAVLGGRILTATEAANYNKANIFGTSNGKQSYSTVFDCDTQYANLRILVGLDEGEVTVDKKYTIDFTEVAKGSTETAGEHFADKLTWTGKGSWNDNSIQVSNDTVITLKVVGRVAITWYPGYGTDSDALVTYDADGMATIKILTASRYIVKIEVDGEDIPEASQTVNVTVDYNDEGATPSGTLVAVVGSTLTKPADPVWEGHKFVGWKVNGADYNFTETVTETFTLVAQWESQGDYDLTAGGTVNFSEFTTGQVNGGNSATYRGVIVEVSEGQKFAPRPANGDAQVNASETAPVKIKFKVNAGTTADQLSVSFTAAAGANYIPTYTVDVETVGDDTYAVVSLTSNSYPTTMTVTIA